MARPSTRAPHAPEPPTYHHGDLRAALIAATEALLAERGPDGFSLREVARRAGVSPAAPAHHFGDAAGLLTAVATQGFAGLTQALRDGVASGGDDALAALRGQGQGYVRFALRHPGRFRLMFRKDMLCADDALTQHADAAFEELAAGVRRAAGVANAAAMTPAHWNAVIMLWSTGARLCAPGHRRPLRALPRRAHGRGLRRRHAAGGAGRRAGRVVQSDAQALWRSSRNLTTTCLEALAVHC